MADFLDPSSLDLVWARSFLCTLNSSETLPLSHASIVDAISHLLFNTRMVDVLELHSRKGGLDPIADYTMRSALVLTSSTPLLVTL